MEKKYQVFVSSTYEDLQEERKKVMEALLQMNCFPVGMEYFNASDSSQWEVIKSLIRECDYYVLIVAGRYGSIEKESGKSYTQKEFEYAIEQGVPVISFVHQHPESLPGTKIESEQSKRDKLEEFKFCVKKKLCKFWDNADGLASQVVLSLNSLIKTNPRIGLVKADKIASEEANKELLKLKEENEKLSNQVNFLSSKVPEGTENFQRGKVEYVIKYYSNEKIYDDDDPLSEVRYSWDDIFLSISTLLLNPVTELQIKDRLEEYLLGDLGKIHKGCMFQILIQLMALKYIVSDTFKSDGVYTYWTLTPYGREEMVKLKAIKK